MKHPVEKHHVGRVTFPCDLGRGSFEASTTVKPWTYPANNNGRRHFPPAVVLGCRALAAILSEECEQGHCSNQLIEIKVYEHL